MVRAPANLTEKLATFADRFSPRTIGTYNNNDIMVAKLEGSFQSRRFAAIQNLVAIAG